jgi:hypothetical protein
VHSYFDGLADITLDWLAREPEASIREALLDHFVAHSERSPVYEDGAKEAYRNAAAGSMLRAKLEARGEGKPIYREFRKIDLQVASADLFGSQTGLFEATTVNKTYNISAQNVASVGDGAHFEGSISQTATNVVEQVEGQLQALLGLLEKAGADARVVEGKQLAVDAKAKPTRGMVEKVLGWMKSAKIASGLVVAGADDFTNIAHKLAELAPHLPIGT